MPVINALFLYEECIAHQLPEPTTVILCLKEVVVREDEAMIRECLRLEGSLGVRNSKSTVFAMFGQLASRGLNRAGHGRFVRFVSPGKVRRTNVKTASFHFDVMFAISSGVSALVRITAGAGKGLGSVVLVALQK